MTGDEQLHRLISLYQLEQITPDEFVELEGRLRDSEDARRIFHCSCRIDARLGVEAGATSNATSELDALTADGRGDTTRRLRTLLAVASVMVVGLLGLLAVEWWPGDESTPDSVVESQARLAEVRYSRGATLKQKRPLNQRSDQDAARTGMRLSRGMYVLESGFVELDFFGGAVLAIEGPAELELISQREARLLKGRVTVEAGDVQTSFLLHTPVGEVLDIGTRYGVHVGDGGITETHVFEGLVDIRQTADRESSRRVEAESAVRITTAGVAESLPVRESEFPQPSRQISGLLQHGNFEPGTELRVGRADSGQWGGDICRIVGERQGIRPFSGDGMLLFQSTGQSQFDGRSSASVASQLSQWIDLTPYRAAIARGRVRAKLSGRFNRVAGDESTDSQFTIHLESFGIAPEDALRLRKSRPGMPRSRVSYDLLSDSDPDSWEDVVAVLALPPNAVYLEATVFAFENVSNDQDTSPEFDGHFADDLQFELIIEPTGSEADGEK